MWMNIIRFLGLRRIKKRWKIFYLYPIKKLIKFRFFMIDKSNLGEIIMFIKQVKEKLGKMTESEKEEWLLAQAK